VFEQGSITPETRIHPPDPHRDVQGELLHVTGDGSWEDMHEIITLQLGQFSNYLATHFWNLQVSFPSFPSPHKLPLRPPTLVDNALRRATLPMRTRSSLLSTPTSIGGPALALMVPRRFSLELSSTI